MFGLSVSTIGDCESDTCGYSRCIAKDWVTPNGMGGCKYRCHSFNECSHIIVDIAGRSGTTITGTLYEIDFYVSVAFMKSVSMLLFYDMDIDNISSSSSKGFT